MCLRVKLRSYKVEGVFGVFEQQLGKASPLVLLVSNFHLGTAWIDMKATF